MLLSILSLRNYLRNKELLNTILFSAASCISLFGTAIYNFAIGLYVLKLTGSGLSFAGTLAISIISIILVNPFAGVLADRLDKKLLAIITDMLNGLLLIGLYMLAREYPLNVSMIYVSTFLLNVFTTVYGISIEAAKSNLVLEKKLISMNSINKVIESSSSILGPVIGGGVFTFLDIKVFIVINSFSFIISALLQLLMDFKFNCSDYGKKKEDINFVTDIIEGITYLRTKREILNIAKVYVALNFCIGLSINAPMPYIINNVLKLDTRLFGIIEAALPIGMILGAIMIKGIMSKYLYGKIVKSANILLSVSMAAIGFSVILHYEVDNKIFYLIYFILIMISIGAAISSIDIPIFYVLQQDIPEEFRGRIISIVVSMAKIILLAALIISGALINIIPTYILPIAGGAGLCIFSFEKYSNLLDCDLNSTIR
ncbi:MFS transporter [Clostridium sp.]|uniref:MFS transporter n=1 Tax=Clostridium sp. TaxID=1506 RepID=UPI00284ADAB4|nr:MFS transporter [Clostridium sp.]MDR3597229.1 MFS transporter [Clostridium sp.]